jgi:hypothetical protein
VGQRIRAAATAAVEKNKGDPMSIVTILIIVVLVLLAIYLFKRVA